MIRNKPNKLYLYTYNYIGIINMYNNSNYNY